MAPEPGRSVSHQRYPQLDLTFHSGVAIVSSGDETLAESGLHLALEPIFRLSEHWGFGLSLQHTYLAWHAVGPEPPPPLSPFPDDDGSISLSQVALAGRWYMLGQSAVSPFMQLAVGYGKYLQIPEHPQCSVSDFLLPLVSAGRGVRYF